MAATSRRTTGSGSAEFRLRDFTLEPWQVAAVDAWDATGRGTLEIFTGGGKTLIALACVARAIARRPGLRVAIVVPTIGLAAQWRAALVRYTTIPDASIGTLGGGKHASLATHAVVVAVLNSAAKHLPDQARALADVMLIVDECHRAGAPTFARVFATKSDFRLGLSATPYRDEVAENGEPIGWDEQILGRELGAVVYSFTLKDAREIGWLPDYAIHHHGIELDPDERAAYAAQNVLVDGAEQRLKEAGGDAGRAWGLQRRGDRLGDLARGYIATITKRKDLVYDVRERARIALKIVLDRFAESPDSRVLIFNERVDAATALFERLRATLPGVGIALEHSALGETDRTRALDAFRSGAARVLVSVKALTEGIDVPGADVGISVASTASVRARVQLLGRVLRRTFDGSEKSAVTHLIYAADTVDTFIYAREDWSDLTGSARNGYFRWPLDGDVPERRDEPPARPSPTEAQEHERLGDLTQTTTAVRWLGLARGAEYSMNAAGVLTNVLGRRVINPQTAASALRAVRGRPDGKLRVTPAYRYLIVYDHDARQQLVAGQLREAFVAEPEPSVAEVVGVDTLRAGDAYAGPPTYERGRARIGSSGDIKRKRRGGGRDVAVLVGSTPQHAAARALLATWRALKLPSIEIGINAAGHVWWHDAAGTHFLGVAPDGLRWPGDASDTAGDAVT